MANVTIKLDSAGIQELLKSNEMADVCEEEAARMTRATGMEYVPDIHIGATRVRAGAYDKDETGEEWSLCPKCGRAHPNCTCNTKG